MKRKKVYFVTGIDTDAGKSYATGYIASLWRGEGSGVITQKLIQTGCDGTSVSEDIVTHRKIMGIPLQPEDLDHTTCPIRFRYPASPDLAARLEGGTVDLALADRSTSKLLETYETVLMEGAGGLMAPIRGTYSMLDYAKERALPLILVTNPRLGSVNHTLMSLEICRINAIEVDVLAFNLWPETSAEITADTRAVFESYISTHMPHCEFIEIPFLNI